MAAHGGNVASRARPLQSATASRHHEATTQSVVLPLSLVLRSVLESHLTLGEVLYIFLCRPEALSVRSR